MNNPANAKFAGNTMRLTRLLLVTLAVTATAFASASAQSDRRKPSIDGTLGPKGGVLAPAKAKPQSSTMAPRPTSAAPLTSKECTQLGGTVGKSAVCKGGKSCTTVDQNHKQHEVCISAQ